MQLYRLSSVLLFLSSITSPLLASKCYPSRDTDCSISGDCDDISCDFTNGSMSTFMRPRTITTDLTYRNSMTFYQRFRGDASCTLFTFDSSFIFQQNRKAARMGRAFFGQQPITIAEQCAPINSLNLELGSMQPEGFCSLVRLSPKRKIFAWLPQLIFHLDVIFPGMWLDMASAIVRADHDFCFYEQVVTPGEINNLTNVEESLFQKEVFPIHSKHTGADDIEIRVGYSMAYCEDDIIALYLLGSIPTGKKFDNSLFFQPFVGSRNGGIGTGIMINSTLWYAEDTDSECLFMGELKYQHKFSNHECRIFDLCNGPLSRFLLVTPESDPHNPTSALSFLRNDALVHPKNQLDFWIALHYEQCGCGVEGGYNLFWRNKECISSGPFDFKEHGIYDMTRCLGKTSHSKARIADAFGQGTADRTFVRLESTDVSIQSAAAQEALSHTFSGVITYNNVWCDYPYSIAFAARYELAGANYHTSTLENWGIFGKASMSF